MLAEMVRVCAVWMLWLCCAAVAGEHAFLREEGLPRWSAMTAQQVMPDVESAVAEAQQRMQAIASLRPEEATFENTFLISETLSARLCTSPIPRATASNLCWITE